jgi:uncharacterized DUF497 family protein
MPIRVSELLFTDAALAKLGARGISTAEAEQVPQNRHEIRPNSAGRRKKDKRVHLIGQTNGGRRLTLVLEPTLDPTTWLTVTGWEN